MKRFVIRPRYCVSEYCVWRREVTCAVLCLAACSGGIVFEGDLSATLGLSASLSCSLPGVGGIKQVTWQHRDPAGSVHAVITLSESLEQLVGEQYAGKVQLAADSLNATTLLIRNITFAEEGCYTCKFYVYPSGTVRETSCLMFPVSAYTIPVNIQITCVQYPH
uniref:Ig-like domain-containing protein n=1 Tax=Astyanax mexicanus TaxID=7994 RepID=A0A3B1K5H7_ASTMX